MATTYPYPQALIERDRIIVDLGQQIKALQAALNDLRDELRITRQLVPQRGLIPWAAGALCQLGFEAKTALEQELFEDLADLAATVEQWYDRCDRGGER